MIKPPLKKTVAVESEEPPAIEENPFLTLPFQRAEEKIIPDVIAADADRAIVELSKTFHVVHPGKFVCKNTTHHATSFVHSSQSVLIGKHYGVLCHLMEERARYLLLRDCIQRLHAISGFVHGLQRIANDEYQMLHQIQRSPLGEIAVTSHLEFINDICEGLRQHMHHWTFIKQRLLHDRWLQAAMLEVLTEMKSVHALLLQMLEKAVYLTDRFIFTSLQVFAHTTLETTTNDVLWDISRGLEEFNSIVSTVTRNSNFELVSRSERYKELHLRNILDARQSNLQCTVLCHVHGMPFRELLKLIGNERSKYAAALLYKFLVTNKDFRDSVNCKLSVVNWRSCLASATSDRVKQAQGDSDYCSATTSSCICADIQLYSTAIDLSNEISPLPDFARREQGFALKFFEVVLQCTSFIRSPIYNSPKHDNDVEKSDVAAATSEWKKRKSVRWCDTVNPLAKLIIKDIPREEPLRQQKDVNLIQRCTHHPSASWTVWVSAAYSRVHTCNHYMDVMWERFGFHFLQQFYQHSWGLVHCDPDHLGHIASLPDSVIMIVVQMLRLVCSKSDPETYPAASLLVLDDVCRKLHQVASHTQWDVVMCEALAAYFTDKCQPVPLANGLYGTKTGKLLRDAYDPLLTLLLLSRELISSRGNNESYAKSQNENVPTRLMLALTPVMSNLLSTMTLAVNWSETKTMQFLVAWNLGHFLLISQLDLKLLTDINQRTLQLLQPLCSYLQNSSSECSTLLAHHLSSVAYIWQGLHNRASKLQTLSSTLIKMFAAVCRQRAFQFFQAEMPLGKYWRRKSSTEDPLEHSIYVEQALLELLLPVVNGTTKLTMESQITVLSFSIVAFCEAWTAYILKEKIRFSVHGARQLMLDFSYVRAWLGQLHDLNSEAMQSLQALEIFKYLNNAVQLLLKQPQKKTIKDGSENVGLETPSSTHSELAMNSSTGLSPVVLTEQQTAEEPDESFPEEGQYCIPNKEEWLALRVHGGTPRWKLPSLSCINSGLECFKLLNYYN